jgi:succinate dehydrogenase cytochrome b556 subunit
MDKTGRPISPHVMIYAFPTIAWSSVMVRVTGILMTFGTTGIACMALGNSDAPAEFAQNLASSSAAPLAKFAVGFPLTYHYLGAARHAFWDATAKGFTNAQMLQSSYALIGASTAISLALCATSLQPSDKKK